MKVRPPQNILPSTTSGDRRERGVTLIEVVMGVALLGFLITSVYQLAMGAMNVANTVADNQQEEMHLHAFLKIMRRNLEGLPGNGSIFMETPRSLTGFYESELVLQDHPMAFSWGGVAAGSEKVIIVTEKDPIGGHQVRVRYLNEEEAELYDEGSLDPDEGLDLVLIDGLRKIEWNFYDPQADPDSEEVWAQDWMLEGQRPSFIELVIGFYDEEEAIRSVFWIPVVANPEEVVAGATGGGNRSSGGGNAQPGGNGGPGAAQPNRGNNARGGPQAGAGRPGGGRPGGGGPRPGGGNVAPPRGGTR
ncbi:MAG: prepilin-type N-terminal cleavage/methylation domain-containing protein [Verrucomicrobiota bacterium]